MSQEFEAGELFIIDLKNVEEIIKNVKKKLKKR